MSSYYLRHSTSFTVSESNFNSIHLLPKNIIELKFFEKFNKPIDKYPDHIENIIFSSCYNQSISSLGKLTKITKLVLPNDFNRPINNLPSSIKELTLGSNFNQTLDMLPVNIEILEIHSIKISKSYIDLSKFKKMKRLVLGKFYDYHVIIFPENLKKLVIPNDYKGVIDNLPNSLTELIFTKLSYSSEKFCPTIRSLPDNLNSLIIYGRPLKSITCLPEKLETFCIILQYFPQEKLLIENIPIGLKKFIIKIWNCKNIDNNILEKIKSLIKLPFGCELVM